ncbi:unnamed protein product [Bursaphelenchus okinawaensis]|uniref:Uncharacterized protein n=1 Tax=Bursaphelenchus okinawaensis TaxID=465554 RepID=A0A811LPH1_9BILA|nr:unnamed protein product [Bursaphelenchus okinawaensis]CAG9125658.1 unnamed protein product [Bursaphelenchus okinawaensis]
MGDFIVEETLCRKDLKVSGNNAIVITGIIVVVLSTLLAFVNSLVFHFVKKSLTEHSENLVEQTHNIMDAVMVCMLPRSLMAKLRGEKSSKPGSVSKESVAT